MRFAYADPPYPGQASRYYQKHRDYEGEVDHRALLRRLVEDYPDGWALSTSATALQHVLSLCQVRPSIAVWHITNTEPAGNRQKTRLKLCWEPVLIWGGRPHRQGEQPIRDLLSCSSRSGFLGASITGQKPPEFCRWVFGLLGAEPGDELDDLFPGSGAVSAEWSAFCAQPWFPGVVEPNDGGHARARAGRRLERLGRIEPLL